MTAQQNRPQTLLDAAKAMSRACEGTSRWDAAVNEFRAAIAREEAIQPGASSHNEILWQHWKERSDIWQSHAAAWNTKHDEQAARAQQAESTAAWHKAESERLSAELAKTKEFRSYAEEAANFGGKWRDRAEDAEAKVRNLQRQNREAIDERDLLRLRTATIDNLRQRAEKAEAELAMMGKQLARLVELQVNPPIMVAHPFEGDPQTCAFGSNAFGGNREVSETDDDYEDPVDPTTGFTFATYRRLLEALGGKS